jgi:hypothetical protein
MNMNATIILTSTVNINPNKWWLFQRDKNERLELYLKSVLQWLTKTNFKIVLVENSGYNYDELNAEKELYKDRFEVLTFVESELEESRYLIDNPHKGASEMFTINYGFFCSKIINPSDFIIKITARYFIPGLEDYLKNYDLNEYDCLTQNSRDSCEMVGSHSKNFNQIFNVNLINKNGQYIGHIEDLWKERTSEYTRILICEPFQIKPTQMGGVNVIRTFL